MPTPSATPWPSSEPTRRETAPGGGTAPEESVRACSPLSAVQPYPPPCPLPDSYDRRRPDLAQQRAVLLDLVMGRAWQHDSWAALIERLLALGRTDIPLSRLAEGHVDAVRILHQARAEPRPAALYGVWASRSQQTGVQAVRLPDGRLRLRGTLAFASGAGLLDRALVPVWLDGRTHLLVDLDVSTLPVDDSVWRTSAMAASRTYAVTVDIVVDQDACIGQPNFYLQRPGFFPGGVGVAACWAGGAARVTDLLRRRHPTPTAGQQLRLGRIRTDLVAAGSVTLAAADALDRLGCAAGPGAAREVVPDWQALSSEARAATADAVRRILAEARLLTGPAGLALDADLAAAIPDLELYVLQQNSDGDATLLGDPERQP